MESGPAVSEVVESGTGVSEVVESSTQDVRERIRGFDKGIEERRRENLTDPEKRLTLVAGSRKSGRLTRRDRMNAFRF